MLAPLQNAIGILPLQYRSIMVKVRLSKLPRPLARSLLMRPNQCISREISILTERHLSQ